MYYFIAASPTVNNVTITADYTLPDGSQVLLISEVLFVSEAVVSRLHQVLFHLLLWLLNTYIPIRNYSTLFLLLDAQR